MSDRAPVCEHEREPARRHVTAHEEKCPYCDGTGIIAASPPDNTRACTRCDGCGWVASCVMEPRS